MTKADWIAVDWGTSALRAWAMNENGDALAEARSERGMGSLQPVEFEAALLECIEDWLDAGATQVVACGMVGARQGWIEASYHETPCKPLGDSFTQAPTTDPRLRVSILAGVSQAKPADVMRGEETQIAGFQAKYPKFDGIVALPGTHTKWVHVSADEIVSFNTAMTGEMFALLSTHSVLRHSVDARDIDEVAFDQAVDETLSRPEKLATALFSLRAEGLLHDMSNTIAKSRLSGLLIGAELAATKAYWLGQPVALIGEDNLSKLYQRALLAQGAHTMTTDATEMTLAGLSAAYDALSSQKD